MLRRPRQDTSDTPPAAPPLDLEVTDVTRLECVLDTGLGLSFDLSSEDSFIEDDLMLIVHMGQRHIKIAQSRILYTETRPAQVKRVVAPPQ